MIVMIVILIISELSQSGQGLCNPLSYIILSSISELLRKTTWNSNTNINYNIFRKWSLAAYPCRPDKWDEGEEGQEGGRGGKTQVLVCSQLIVKARMKQQLRAGAHSKRAQSRLFGVIFVPQETNSLWFRLEYFCFL